MSTSLGRREPCVACGQPVFLAQRLLVERRLYHRTCFTCARCGAQLSLASCYQTETDGQFCCETCPDEETDSIEDDSATDSIKTGDTNTSKGEDLKSDTTRGSGKNYDRLLSDEEKVRNVQQFKDVLDAEDSAFNRSMRGHSIKSSTPSSKALSGFLNTQFQQSDDEEAPALPSTLPPMSPEKVHSQNLHQISSPMDLEIFTPAEESLNTVRPVIEKDKSYGFESELSPPVSVCEATDSVNLKHSNSKKVSDESVDKKLLEISPSKDKLVHKSEASSAPSTEDKNELQIKFDSLVKKEVASPEKVDSSSREKRLQNVNKENVNVNQLKTASDLKKENDSNQNNARDDIDVRAEFDDVIAKENQRNVKSDTFDDKKNIDGEMSQGSSSPSLVKMRMKLFETASPETNRLSGITASPIGSRKSALDQDKLVLTKDKLALSENVTSYSSDSTIKVPTIDVVRVEVEIPASSIPEITLSHVEMESGVKEESQISEMNVPCIEDIMPFSDSTKSNDIDSVSEDKDNPEVVEVFSTDIPITVIELKEENIVCSEITDKFEDITEDKNDVMNDVNMEISNENIDIKDEQLDTEVIIPSTIKDTPDITEKETVDVIVNTESHEDIIEKETVELTEKETVKETVPLSEKETVQLTEKETVQLTEIETVQLIEKETISEEGKIIEVDKEDVKNVVEEKDFIPEVESTDVKDIDGDLTNVSSIEIAEIETSMPTDNEEYPDDLNPFGSEDDDEQMPKAPARKVIAATNRYSMLSHMESTIEVIASPPEKVSTNPFGSCSEDEEEPKPPVKRKSGEKPPRPPPPAILISSMRQSLTTMSEPKKLIPAPNLNPFDSDDDEVSEDDKQTQTPVPTPRQRIGDGQEPLPVPRTSLGSAGPPSFHGSTSSLTSTISRRKKAPAPKPPAASIFDSPVAAPRTTNLKLEDNDLSMVSTLSTPNSSLLTSPQLSPRSRKRRPAPAPPTACSTFIESLDYASLPASPAPPSLPHPLLSSAVSSSTVDLDARSLTSVNGSSRRIISAVEFDEPDPEMVTSGEWDSDKLKDDTNDSKGKSASYENKSTSGVWKRRKGPAPAVPLLQRRAPVQPLSAAAIRRELALLEEQQRGLERQGVRLEEIIRDRGEGLPEGAPDAETDELVLQLFELVNEKNELFRRQAELMYIRRQQRLEEEHCDLEHQLRCMMARPEANKTDADKAREEQLLQRLLAVVARRDEVVGALEAERLRERREDQAIREQMIAHRAKLDENSSLSSAESQASMAKKEKKKEKKKWMKRDKDKQKKTDDTNISEETETTVIKKEKKIKKWF